MDLERVPYLQASAMNFNKRGYDPDREAHVKRQRVQRALDRYEHEARFAEHIAASKNERQYPVSVPQVRSVESQQFALNESINRHTPREFFRTPDQQFLDRQKPKPDSQSLQVNGNEFLAWLEAAVPDLEAPGIPTAMSIPIDWDHFGNAPTGPYLPRDAWNIRSLSPEARALVHAGLKFYGRVVRYNVGNHGAHAWSLIQKYSQKLLKAESYWYGQFQLGSLTTTYRIIADVQGLSGLGEDALPNVYYDLTVILGDDFNSKMAAYMRLQRDDDQQVSYQQNAMNGSDKLVPRKVQQDGEIDGMNNLVVQHLERETVLSTPMDQEELHMTRSLNKQVSADETKERSLAPTSVADRNWVTADLNPTQVKRISAQGEDISAENIGRPSAVTAESMNSLPEHVTHHLKARETDADKTLTLDQSIHTPSSIATDTASFPTTGEVRAGTALQVLANTPSTPDMSSPGEIIHWRQQQKGGPDQAKHPLDKNKMPPYPSPDHIRLAFPVYQDNGVEIYEDGQTREQANSQILRKHDVFRERVERDILDGLLHPAHKYWQSRQWKAPKKLSKNAEKRLARKIEVDKILQRVNGGRQPQLPLGLRERIEREIAAAERSAKNNQKA